MALIDKYRNLLNRADTAIDKRASQLRQAYSKRIAPRQSLSQPRFQYSNATNTPQYKVLNSLARYQKAFSNPKRIEVLPNLDTKKARNIPLTIGAGLVEAAINEPRQQIADIGNAGYAIRTRKTGLRTGDVRNTANFNPQSNLFKLTNNVLDTIREDQNPLETVKLTSKYGDKRVLGYGRGKWNVPLTNVNLPEMGFSESNLAKMGKQVAGVAEPFAAYYGAMKPALVAGYTGLGGGVNATLNYALGNKDLKGNFIEGANLAGRDAVVSAGYLNKTNPIVDKLGAKGLKGLPVKSAVNVTQGLGQNAVTGTENSAESIILDALFPVFNELGSKSFGTADQALRAGQAKVKTALGMKLRNNKGLYTTAEKFAKGTRAYRKSGKYANGALLGVEPYQDEDGKWKVRFNKERALLGLGVGIGMTKNVTNGSVKDLADSLNRSEIGKSLDEATKQSVLEEAQRMLAGGIGDTGVIGNARYSANPDWYREFYAQAKRAPTNEEFFDLALSRVKPQQGAESVEDVLKAFAVDTPTSEMVAPVEQTDGFADKMFGKLGIVDDDPLLQEARKYKSAEEFIKARVGGGDNVYYHGTTKAGADNIDKVGFIKTKGGFNKGRGISVSKEYGVSNEFASGGVFGKSKARNGDVFKVEVDPKAKVVDVQDFLDLRNELKESIVLSASDIKAERARLGVPELSMADETRLKFRMANDLAYKEFESRGVDIIDASKRAFTVGQEQAESIILNPAVIKSRTRVGNKSQLTDIWNKANKSGVEDNLLNEARKYKSAEEFIRRMERGRAGWGTSTVRINPIQNAIDHTPFVGKPGKEVEIFRVTPGNIEAGDFVFTSREAAEKYMKTQGSTTPGSIKSMKVDSSEIAPAFDAETQINNRYIGSYLYKKDRKPSFSSVESIYVPKSVQGIDLTDIWNKANQPINSPYSMGIVGNSPVKPDLTKDIGGEAKKFEDYLKGNEAPDTTRDLGGGVLKSKYDDYINNPPRNQQQIDETELKNVLADEEIPRWKEGLNQVLNPLKNAPKEIQDRLQDWRGKTLSAKQSANAEFQRFSHIPEDDGLKIMKYIQNPTADNARRLKLNVNRYSGDLAQIRSYYDGLRNEALQKGLKVDYVENYLNQVWKESPKEIAKKAGLGKNPSFTQMKAIPNYETGMALGLTPKFTHPAQLVAHYRLQLDKAVANQELVNDLLQSGYLLKAKDAPLDWRTIESPLAGGLEGYKASPQVAKALNNMFSTEKNILLDFGAKVSKGMQDLTMSGGFGPLNSFSVGNAIKDITAGRFKSPITSFVRSWSGDSSKRFFTENARYTEMMARDGIPVHSNADYTTAFRNLAQSKTLKERLGDGWDKFLNEPTFKRFIPMLQVNMYKDVYEGGLKRGLSEAQARQLASQTTRNFYGVVDNFTRSNDAENALSTMFFAPKFRESMINFWINNVRAMDVRKPEYAYNRRFILGTAITFGIMNALNYSLNGRWMHDNKDGKELSIEIPVGEGRSWYIPILPSISTVPRRAIEAASALKGGDVAKAAERGSSFLSQPIQLGTQLASNETFYGGPIYDRKKDTPLQKYKKLAGYALEQSSHPFIGEPVSVIQGRKSIPEGALGVLEMPVYPSKSTKPSENTAKGMTPVMAQEDRKLPSGEDLGILYKSLSSELDGARKDRVSIQWNANLTDEEKEEKMEALRNDIFQKSSLMKQIQREKPFEVFKIELEGHSSGSGKNVEERGEWVMSQINRLAKEGKRDVIPQLLQVMWDNKVLTSGKDGVAAYIASNYGVDVSTKTSGKAKAKKAKPKAITLKKLESFAPKANYRETDQVELSIPNFTPPVTLSGNNLGGFTPSANLEKIRRSSLTR